MTDVDESKTPKYLMSEKFREQLKGCDWNDWYNYVHSIDPNEEKNISMTEEHLQGWIDFMKVYKK
jgi:hypothetical protein